MAAGVPTDRWLIAGHVGGLVHRWAHAQASRQCGSALASEVPSDDDVDMNSARRSQHPSAALRLLATTSQLHLWHLTSTRNARIASVASTADGHTFSALAMRHLIAGCCNARADRRCARSSPRTTDGG
jgi:hypothetical protein